MPAQNTKPAPPEHCRPATPAQREKGDRLFDSLSEALRDATDPAATPETAAKAAARADKALDSLNAWLSRGGALPGPWCKARH